MAEKNGNITYKLTVESRLTRVETTLDDIKDNHLPHIEKKVDWLIGLVILTLLSVVVELGIRYLS